MYLFLSSFFCVMQTIRKNVVVNGPCKRYFIFSWFSVSDVCFYVRRSGSKVAVLNEHTFNRHYSTNIFERWACSNRDTKKCKAFFIITKEQELFRINLEHTHPPIKYYTTDGVYYKM